MFSFASCVSAAFFVTAILLPAVVAAQEQHQVIPVYPGVAPGSESWTQQEAVTTLPGNNEKRVRNVVKPTLTVYLPKANANGTAIIVAPGGGFRFLSWESEGTEVAQWLADHGITVFILKYRLEDTGATDAEFQKNIMAMFQQMMAPPKQGATQISDAEMDKTMLLAAEDGRQAVKLVREHAAEYKIDPNRIGIMGFSAGGMVTEQVMLHHTDATRPNFAAPIYAPAAADLTIPSDVPPAFLLCADNDPLTAMGEIRLYTELHRAGKSAELHIYSQGGHGFGMNQTGLPVNTWIDRYYDWLNISGFLKAKQ